MTSRPTPAPGQVSAAEIASLLAWARSLTKAGPAADPADRAAYLTAKTDLLNRITDQHTDTTATKDTE
jgi:hypothetical protein